MVVINRQELVVLLLCDLMAHTLAVDDGRQAVLALTLQELEALYYDMSTKNYINE